MRVHISKISKKINECLHKNYISTLLLHNYILKCIVLMKSNFFRQNFLNK